MNVLHIVYADVWGGGETAALSMCKTLKKNGDNVYVLVAGNINLLEKKFQQVGSVFTIRMSWWRLLPCLLKIRRIVLDNKIDIIHTHTGRVIPFVLLANWNLGSKVIAYRHNALNNKKDIIHKLIYKRLDAMVCVSEFVKKHQEKDMPNWVKSKLYVIHNGIEINRRLPHVLKVHENFVVGYAGRIEGNKGLLHLVGALEKLDDRNIILKIAGDDRTEYANLIKKHLKGKSFEQRVHWIGYIEDINTFYEQIDLLVAPSIVPEAFGLSVCEAMYHGKPVVASNNGAQGEIISDGIDGFLINPGDEEKIAERIMELKNNHDKCMIMGETARKKIVENYTMDCWLRKMLIVYNKVAADKR